MEGLYANPYPRRTYTPPRPARPLRRETRSIAEWREKGKFLRESVSQPYLQRRGEMGRARTWCSGEARRGWAPTIEVEFVVYDDECECGFAEEEEEEEEDLEVADGLVYGTRQADDYFSMKAPAWAPEAIYEPTEQPVILDRTEEFIPAPTLAEIREPSPAPTLVEPEAASAPISLPKPVSAPPLKPTPPPTPSSSRPPTPKIIEEEVDTSEPPSPEDIIELHKKPATPPPAPVAITARTRFIKAAKLLKAVDMVVKSIPPAPAPEDLIPEPIRRPRKMTAKSAPAVPLREKAQLAIPTLPRREKSFAEVEQEILMLVSEEPEDSEEPEEPTPIPAITIEPATIPLPLSPPTTPISTIHLFPVVRSDEGYNSCDSEDEDESAHFGVLLPTTPTEPDVAAAAPLPEDLIITTPEKKSERYQHHCLLHGHFFPKQGPLRSTSPSTPFKPTICCERCKDGPLCEAWQCSLLNQCGIIVCTPCHDELEYGVRPEAPATPPSLLLDAKVEGVREGMELGLHRGMRIVEEVAAAGRAREVVASRELEEARRAREK